ncbi:MAG: RNA-binding protein [Geminicoccaceae bacterium]
MVPKTPKGGKRPADVIGNAVHVMRIAVGEIEDDMPADDGKNQAAVALGKKGGAARAAKLTAEERAEIARKAALKRWATVGNNYRNNFLAIRPSGAHFRRVQEDDA